MDRPQPWLRYVDAGDLDDEDVNFDGLAVQNGGGEKLGKVDGFIVDSESGRPYHIVVDSGGWFKSRHYLLPVGHARLDTSRKTLVADLTRERVELFPGFDKDKFDRLTDQEIEQIDAGTTAACCPAEIGTTTGPNSWVERRSHYRVPDWWQSNYYRPDRAGASGVTAGAEWSGTSRTTSRATVHDRPKRP
jgi:hypothetical protein